MGVLREPCLASLWLPRPQSFGCVLLLFVWRFGGEYVGYEKYFLLEDAYLVDYVVMRGDGDDFPEDRGY